MYRILISTALAMALAGCVSRGVDSSDHTITQSFTVQADYQSAYRRATEYFRVCWIQPPHRYNAQYDVSRDVDFKGTTTSVRLFNVKEPTKTLEQFSSRPSGLVTAEVTMRVLGENVWDQAELDAAKQSLLSATPVCRPDTDHDPIPVVPRVGAEQRENDAYPPRN
jgi:hypothetical protein